MAALPGLTCTSLTKECTKALVSVSSQVLRKSLISSAKVAMVSALSRPGQHVSLEGGAYSWLAGQLASAG